MDNNINEYNEMAELLKTLAHPVRICIVKGLIKNKGCNVTHMKECLGIPQSTVSQHLQKLRNAGIIKGERHGLEIKYTVVNNDVMKIVEVLFN